MISFFARHPTAANLLMVAFLTLGILSLPTLRRETFPDFQTREVEIRVPYPGATPEEVEEAICQRIEDAIDNVRFVEETRCDARQNMGVVTVEMVPDGDWSAFKDEIDTAIAAIDDFPDRAEEATVRELHTTDPVLTVLVAGEMPAGDLKLYAEGLKDQLQEIPEVNIVDIEGFADHQLRVELSSDALIRFGLSPADVADAIRRQSVDVPAGTVEATHEDVLVRFSEERQTAKELGDLVVLGGPAGAEVRIRELGKVVDEFELAEDKAILYKASAQEDEHAPRRAAILRVKQTDTQDTLVVAGAVKQFIAREQAAQPAIDLIITQDISLLVSDRLGLLVKNGWQGMILVFLTMWLFFNARLSLWVAASLPVSFLGAFFFMPQLDLTINMMTMVALLLGIGILMDDGIVIAENIAAHHRRGKKPLQAAIDGVREVSSGVVSSFLTTICVLGPLAFLEGNVGRILRVVPVVLLLVLSVSLVEAFLILPSHLGHSMQGHRQRNWLRGRIDTSFEWVRQNVLGRIVDLLVRWRYAWMGCVLAAFLASVALPAGGILKFQALPELDGDTAVARVLMPQGTPLKKTEQVVDRLVASLVNVDDRLSPLQPDNERLVKTIYARYNENADAFEAGPHVVTVYADLLTAERRTTGLEDLYAEWRDEVGKAPASLAINYTDPSPAPTGRNIEVRARGKDLHELRAVTLDLKDWLGRFHGVENLTTDLRPGKREYRIRFRPGVLGLELDSARMAAQLRAAFQGQQATEIQVGSESYEVEVRFDRESRREIDDLLGFRFTLPGGAQVPLASVATVQETRSWSRIARVNGLRTATLRGDVDSRVGNTAAVLAELKSQYLPGLRERHPGVSFQLDGETAEAAKTGKSLARGMAVGVIGVFILLSFQFRSYVEPLIVMVAIPGALIGVIWGHLLMGYPLTMPSILGFVSLAGVVVNDSILLVLFLKQSRRAGMEPTKAACQASRDRFRAIIMTSLTTMAGLIPLTFESSLQAIVLIPLALSIVFGMLTSTVLVLLVIPCLYVVLDDLGLAAKLDESEDEVPETAIASPTVGCAEPM
jgi:multidrug efflux pump subunit AcrB